MFVQDVAFKESVAVCAGLLFLSLVLHGLAYRAGQCQVRVIRGVAGGVRVGNSQCAWAASLEQLANEAAVDSRLTREVALRHGNQGSMQLAALAHSALWHLSLLQRSL